MVSILCLAGMDKHQCLVEEKSCHLCEPEKDMNEFAVSLSVHMSDVNASDGSFWITLQTVALNSSASGSIQMVTVARLCSL